jgi:DNA-binding GntR family transcriptional regulator
VPCARQDLELLERDVKLMQQAAREQDHDAYMDSAVNFHRHIVQMSGNELFLRAWEHMAWDILARIAVQRIGLIGVFARERKAVIAALRAGDGESAGRGLREIIGRLLERLAQISQAAEPAKAGAALAD